MRRLFCAILVLFFVLSFCWIQDSQAGWKDKARDLGNKAKEKGRDWGNKAKDKGKDWGSKAKDWGSKAKDWGGKAWDKARDYSLKYKQKWNQLKKSAIQWANKAKTFSRPYLNNFKNKYKKEISKLLEASKDALKKFDSSNYSVNLKKYFDVYMSKFNKYAEVLNRRLQNCPDKYIGLVAAYVGNNPEKAATILCEVSNFVGFVAETKSIKKAIYMEGVNLLSKVPIQVKGELMTVETYCQELIAERVPFLAGTDVTNDLSNVVMYGLIAKDKKYLLNQMNILPSKRNPSQRLSVRDWMFEYADTKGVNLSGMVEISKSFEILNDASNEPNVLKLASSGLNNLADYVEAGGAGYRLSSLDFTEKNFVQSNDRNYEWIFALSLLALFLAIILVNNMVNENYEAEAIPVDEPSSADAIPISHQSIEESNYKNHGNYNRLPEKKSGFLKFVKFVFIFCIIIGILALVSWFAFYKDYYSKSKDIYALGEKAFNEGYFDTAQICFDVIKDKYSFSLIASDAKEKIKNIQEIKRCIK